MAQKKKSATRRLLIIVGILAVVVVLAIVGAKLAGFGGGPKATEVELADVALRSITQVVTASGKVQPETEVKISPDVSGEIVALTVQEGDQVKRGQLLARIKPDFYQAQVEQAEAAVLQARAAEAQRRADVLSAELDYNRQKELFDRSAVSASVLEQAKTRYDIAVASLEGARYAVQASEARLRESRESLAKTTIFAPMDGTVSKLNVEAGERVVGTSQMTGTEMMRIAKLDQMEIEVDVNENDVVNITLGDTASVEVDAYPGRKFKGAVTEIANSARVSGAGSQEQVTNFPVKIRILDAHNILASGAPGGEVLGTDGEVPGSVPGAPSFRPGMSGTVDVYTETLDNVLAVPIQAVTVRDVNALKREALEKENKGKPDAAETDTSAVVLEEEDLRRVIFLFVDGKAEMSEVETGISDDTHIVIKTGVSAGQRVVTGPFRIVSRTLKPGDAVQEMKDRPLVVRTETEEEN